MLLMVVAIIIVLLIAALRNSYLRFLLLDMLHAVLWHKKGILERHRSLSVKRHTVRSCMQFCGIKKGFLSVIVVFR